MPDVAQILCAVDFSKYSRSVVDCACALAEVFRAHVTVLHVLSYPRNPLEDQTVQDAAVQPTDVADIQKRIASLMAQRSIDWEAKVLPGEPVETICRYARESGSDLVVAASYGLSGLKRFLLGTVVESLARALDRPLLVLRPAVYPEPRAIPAAPHPRRILLCCDPTPAASRLISHGLSFASRFDAQLHLVNILESPAEVDGCETDGRSYGEIQQSLLERTRRRIEGLVPQSMRSRVDLVVSVLAAEPGDGLLDYARDSEMDLVIVGVRRRGRWRKILIGSTTEVMLRRSPCNVLTVPLA
jgi:nucleotide-binding universal stress UspA family protein